jgi:hypothetical protein
VAEVALGHQRLTGREPALGRHACDRVEVLIGTPGQRRQRGEPTPIHAAII